MVGLGALRLTPLLRRAEVSVSVGRGGLVQAQRTRAISSKRMQHAKPIIPSLLISEILLEMAVVSSSPRSSPCASDAYHG